MFFLSIPVTLFTYSSYSSYSQTYNLELSNNGLTSEARRLGSAADLYYYGYWGAIGINGLLFINLVIDAVDYVKSAGQDFKPPETVGE